jgi:ADP-ribosyl-[dinitrogen reductase] hydrolase
MQDDGTVYAILRWAVSRVRENKQSRHSNIRDRFDGCLFGLAVGDALGTSVEFRPRGTFEPVVDMCGGGLFNLEPGQWTDDTSMALCLATSLIECKGHDPHDQMTRYLKWRDEGYLSSTGKCFDIGNTVYTALKRFKHTDNPYSGPTDKLGASNGALMRLAPVAMLHVNGSKEDLLTACADSTRTTHALSICIEASQLLGAILRRAISGYAKDTSLLGTEVGLFKSDSIANLAKGSYAHKIEQDIVSNGQVANSLEAALWCFLNTDNFKDAVLKAVNLGDDADTTGAICGQLAGAYYGKSAIPPHWIAQLAMLKTIEDACDGLAKLALPNTDLTA